jgi:hypothetical protein
MWLPASSSAQKHMGVANIKCSFDPIQISPTILEFTSNASPSYRILITRMFAYCGQRNLPIFIGNTTSADLDYACCGYNQRDQPSIILNEERLNTLPKSAVYSILAHEIGHFNDRHIDDSILTMQMELDADYHNGFWCSRNGINNLDSIYFPYTLIGIDSIHPSYEVRTEEVRKGYLEGEKKFEQNFLFNDSISKADNFKNSVDLILTVDPKFRIIRGKKKYTVYVNTAVIDVAKFSDSQILSSISFVRYVIDPTFRNQLLISKNKVKNFEYLLTYVYGDFPVTAIVRFSDDSEFSITKTFKLPE